jgi:S1-C subfamily serine protease
MIGMNTAILSGTNTFSGIGFAIPSNDITRIVPTLIGKGYYPHPWIRWDGTCNDVCYRD